jgi:hypothetical protein
MDKLESLSCGSRHPLVRLTRVLEQLFARSASAAFCVTKVGSFSTSSVKVAISSTGNEIENLGVLPVVFFENIFQLNLIFRSTLVETGTGTHYSSVLNYRALCALSEA